MSFVPCSSAGSTAGEVIGIGSLQSKDVEFRCVHQRALHGRSE